MKYINIDCQGQVNNREPSVADGVHQQDVITVTYQKLVETFGQPNDETDGFKLDANWLIFTPAGVATIHNWKDGKNYLGDRGLEVEQITEWHICAHSTGPADWIKLALGLKWQDKGCSERS